MSLQEMIQEAQKLSLAERRELIKALVDTLTDTVPHGMHKRTLREFRGVGTRLYDGTDAQDYVNQLRREWDDRP